MSARVHADVRAAVGVGVLLAVLTLGVYAPTLRYEFLNYDDDEYVTENPVVRRGLTIDGLLWAFTEPHSATWHPVTGLSHMLDVELFGLNAGAHHTMNVVLHAAAALVLLVVLHRMTSALWPSACVAFLFALHPLHVESVAWISERKDVLSALFWMLTLWSYLAYVRRPGRMPYARLIVVFTLALLAKPMVITLPFVLLLLDAWPLGRLARGSFGRLVVEKMPLMVLAASVSAATLLAQSRVGAVASFESVPLGFRLANALVAYATYLRKTLWPFDLAVFYPLRPLPTWRIGVAALVLVAISAFALREARRRPYLLVGWLWYLGTLVPVIGIIRAGEQAMADRFTYLPHIGVFIALAWGAAELAARRRTLVLGAVAFTLVACTVLTWRQVERWQSSVTLFRHALAVTTDNYVAHTNLAAALRAHGQHEEAMTHHAAALRIKPDYAKAHVNFGVALAARREEDAAVAHYREALRLDPGYAMAEYNWALVLAARGKRAEAIAHYRRALELDPGYANAHNNLGSALAAEGKLDEAVTHYREALRIAPDLAPAHNNLAIALEGLGRTTEAVHHYEHAVKLAPVDAGTRFNLAAALVGQGRVEDAIAQYREVLRIKPGWSDAEQALTSLVTKHADPSARSSQLDGLPMDAP